MTDIFSFSVCIIKLFLYRPLCGFSPLSESICCSAPGSPHLGISTTPSSPGGTKQHLHKMICLVNPDQGGWSHSTICCILIGHLCPCAPWTELKLKSDYSRFTSSKIMLPACLAVEDKSIWWPTLYSLLNRVWQGPLWCVVIDGRQHSLRGVSPGQSPKPLSISPNNYTWLLVRHECHNK